MSIEDRTFYSVETPLLIGQARADYYHPGLPITFSGQLLLNARNYKGELAIVETFDLIQTYDDPEFQQYGCAGRSDNGYYVNIDGSYGEGNEWHGLTLYSPDYFDDSYIVTITDGSEVLDADNVSFGLANLSGLLLDDFDRSTCNFNVAMPWKDGYTEQAAGVCYNWSDEFDVITTRLEFQDRMFFAESDSWDGYTIWWPQNAWDDISSQMKGAPTWDEILEYCKDGNRAYFKFDFIRPINKVMYGEEPIVDLLDEDYPLADISEITNEYGFIDKSGVVLPGSSMVQNYGDIELNMVFGDYFENGYITTALPDVWTKTILTVYGHNHIKPGYTIGGYNGISDLRYFYASLVYHGEEAAHGYVDSWMAAAWRDEREQQLANNTTICGLYQVRDDDYSVYAPTSLNAVQYIGNHQIKMTSDGIFSFDYNEDVDNYLLTASASNAGIWRSANKLKDYTVYNFPEFV